MGWLGEYPEWFEAGLNSGRAAAFRRSLDANLGRDTAEEIARNAAVKVMAIADEKEQHDSFPNVFAFRGWCRKAAWRAAGPLIGRAYRYRPLPDGATELLEGDPGDADAGILVERLLLLRAQFAKLSATDRRLLTWKYEDGLSLREIAEILAIPEGTAGRRLFDARERLRKLLEAGNQNAG